MKQLVPTNDCKFCDFSITTDITFLPKYRFARKAPDIRNAKRESVLWFRALLITSED